MEDKIVKTPREIGKEVKAFFKNNGITHKDAADRLGFASKQVVTNQLAGKKFGPRTAARYASVFGFSESFLVAGLGELAAEGEDEVSRLRMEVEYLRHLVLVLAEANKNILEQSKSG